MAWIESHQSLRDHPKTRRLARSLSTSVPASIGHLHCLWWWAIEYAPSGSLSQFEDWEIAAAAMWDGDPAVFLQGLRDARFVDGDALHDWDEYAGRLVSSRAKARERMAAYRSKAKRARSANEPETCDSTVHNSTQHNSTQQHRSVATPASATLDAAWSPDATLMAWATAQGFKEPWVATQTEKFRDYYVGTGKTMSDWGATWRNWLRRDAERNPAKQAVARGDWFGE